ncbi:MAG: hypothetical protein K2Q26_01830 [Bdellovibrionales bacterium]|nr:hypothetical protein [Bdellovibrionales bacterium]
MKKFNYRLDSFLKIKQFEEKIAWNEVLKQEGRILLLREQIDTIHRQIQVSRDTVSRTGTGDGSFQVNTANLLHMGIEGLGFRVKEIEAQLKKEMSILQKLKDRHAEMKKEAKTLETHKDKKKAAYKKEVGKKDILRLSEVGAQRMAKRKLDE